MKFTSTFSAFLVVLPLIANVSGLAVPEGRSLPSRQRGGKGGQQAQQAKGGAQAAQAAQQAAAAKAAAASKAAAAAAAAKGGKGGAAATTAAAAAGTAAAPPPAAAAGNGGGGGGGDLQSSTTLSPTVIQNTDNGQNPPVAGQAAALVSANNFINLCAATLPQVPLTNGLQITSGSCNPTPIGNIPSTANMPASKFQSPKNMDVIQSNTPFNITVQVQKIQLGTFTNAAKTYYANPQTLNAQGAIIGHTHIVVEAIPSLTSTAVTDSTKFVFFKGINGGQDAQGNVAAEVTEGLPAGTYRIGTILSSQTHQPVIMPVAQHGLVDDVIYVRCVLCVLCFSFIYPGLLDDRV
ncbi:hypothetical protein C8R46DRAFT_1007637 [Mycena filopes]|nr:hypothetical protein C8R46DRAFT_1007637 [Mycena filopes]